MTQLRNKMLKELQRRNYSHRTAKTYIRIVREFAEYFRERYLNHILSASCDRVKLGK